MLADIKLEMWANASGDDEPKPKIHVALDLESVAGADGVTDPATDKSDLFKANEVIEIVQNIAKVAGR